MTRFRYIEENINRIKEEVKLGFVSTCVLKHYEVYSKFDYYRGKGYNVRMSVLFAGDDFKVEERTIFRIIKNMEEEI